VGICLYLGISLPQDITTIIEYLPHHVSDLGYFGCHTPSFWTKNFCVKLVLKYKLENDPYKEDVWPNQNANRELLITLLSLSQFLHHMETSILESEYNYKQPDALHRSFIDQGVQQPSSFVATLPNAHT
jgi:hypothetical protein